MEIIWFGHACCVLKNGAATLVTDPYDDSLGLNLPELEADIVTVSHNNPRHNAVHTVQGPHKVVNRPGEYEIKGVFISGHIISPPETDRSPDADAQNVVFVCEIDDITVCHLGDIRCVPTQSQVEALNSIDVLLIPVGGGRSLNAVQASELISIIDPSIVVPIHYHLPGINISLDPLDKFLKEIGHSQLETRPRLRLRRSTLPSERQLVVLEPRIN